MTPITIAVLLGVVVLDVVLIGLFALLARRRGLVDQRLGQLSQSGQVAVADAPKAPGKRASPFGRVLDQAVANRGHVKTRHDDALVPLGDLVPDGQREWHWP